jgi:hypothetical protein
MTKTFKFNDEAICPECNKSLDDCPARDFIVFDRSGNPTSDKQEHECGWCDAMLSIYMTSPGTIVIKNKY